jgi:hypothetical protein
MNLKKFISVEDLPNPEDVQNYVDDTGANWGIEASDAVFSLQRVPLLDLEKARARKVELSGVWKTMAGQTYSHGFPMILDTDLSVIDGMHRLADQLDGIGPFLSEDITIDAYVRYDVSEYK